MIDTVKYLLAGLCLAIAAAKAFQYKRRGVANPAATYAIACFTLLGLAALVIAPGTLRAASTVEPLPNMARWVGNSLVIAAAFCTFGILAHTVQDPAQVRRIVTRQAVIAGIVAASMGVLLVLGDTRFTTEFVTEYGNRPAITAYLALFSAYCGWGLFAFVRLVRRYSAATPERPLRVGLNIMMSGAFVGLLWAAWKTVVLVVNRISPEPVKAEALITALLSSTAAALVAIGAMVPLVIRYLRDPVVRARTARHNRQLQPLWEAAHHALPEINLDPTHGDDEFVVYRRVIEIRDANLALRVHCHPDVRAWATAAAQARGVVGDQVEVIVEASVIAAAIEAHAAGVRYHTDPSTAETPRSGTGDVNAERDWLIRVSQAFTQDPVVQEIRQRVRDEAASAQVENG